MRLYLTALGALALTTSAATAGGIDRSGQSILSIFEKGNYAELSFGSISPSVSGTAVAVQVPGLNGASSGDMAAHYNQTALSVKTQLNDSLDLGIILDQPFGASVSYPTGTGYYAQGSVATLETTALTAIAKYRLANNISFFGGLRYQTMQAEASIPFIPSDGYTVVSDTADGLGYVAGVAYEKPEIALRVALTYNSQITHDFTTVETSVFAQYVPTETATQVVTPQSVNLEFQSGVAKDTLVFGSVRWVDWNNFEIDPPLYPPGSPLVSYDSDTVTYSLGVGRRLTEHWAAAITFGYEDPVGGFSSNLGPTDGKKSISLGGTYTRDNMKISAGVSYVAIGDTATTLDDINTAANFTGNSALGVGVKIGFTF
jgi:long-subunit fatty acid transport protein